MKSGAEHRVNGDGDHIAIDLGGAERAYFPQREPDRRQNGRTEKLLPQPKPRLVHAAQFRRAPARAFLPFFVAGDSAEKPGFAPPAGRICQCPRIFAGCLVEFRPVPGAFVP